MKIIHEAVQLPDINRQPLVHPLDIPEARRTFEISWWLALLALPTVFFGIAATLWAVSNNKVTPILVPTVIAVCAIFARRYFESEAWAHIPRKRQDPDRKLPLGRSLLRQGISALFLLGGLLMLTLWLGARGLPPEITAYMIGMGAGIVVTMVAQVLWTLVAPARLSRELGGWGSQLAGLVVVAAALLFGFTVLGGAQGAGAWESSDVITGAAIIIGVQALWWASRFWKVGRRTGSSEPAAA